MSKRILFFLIFSLIGVILFFRWQASLTISIFKPSFSPNGENILAAVSRKTKSGLYQWEIDGSNPKRLTTPRSNEEEWAAAYSPDGLKIVFSRKVNKEFHLYLMNADGTNQVQLTQVYDQSPIFSGDGKRIYFLRGENRNVTSIPQPYQALLKNRLKDYSIYSIDLKGSALLRIAMGGECSMFSDALAISPDYKSLMCEAFNKEKSAIFRIISLETPNQIQEIAPDIRQFFEPNLQLTKTYFRDPAFSPDGKLIAFVAFSNFKNTEGRRLNDSTHEIYLFNRETQKTTKLVDIHSHYVKWPSFSPNGKELIFCSGRPYSCQSLWKVNTDGSDLQEIKLVIP